MSAILDRLRNRALPNLEVAQFWWAMGFISAIMMFGPLAIPKSADPNISLVLCLISICGIALFAISKVALRDRRVA